MKIKVEFEADIGVSATPEEIESWVEFCLGAIGVLSGDNPLIDHELEADTLSVRVKKA